MHLARLCKLCYDNYDNRYHCYPAALTNGFVKEEDILVVVVLGVRPSWAKCGEVARTLD